MMADRIRSRPCGSPEARARLRVARAYLATAELVADDSTPGFAHVATGVAVLAAIAASDAICCGLLRERARGESHRQAPELLATVRFGPGRPQDQAERARRLADAFTIALELKDESHYGTKLMGADQVRRAIRAAGSLVAAASEAVEA